MMKTFDLKSLLLGVVLTMMIVVVMLIATPSNAPVAWEYQILHRSMSGLTFHDRLNSAAKDGWEVVGFGMDKDDHPLAMLRRAKAVQRPAWWKFWKK